MREPPRASAKCSSRPATPARRASRRCATSPWPPRTSRHSSNWPRRERVDLTIVGPEAPLVAGIVDAFRRAGSPASGPARWRAARGLEGLHQGVPAAPRHPHRRLPRPSPARASMPTGCARSARRSSSRRADSPPARASSSRRASTEALAAAQAMFAGQFGAAGERSGDRGVPRGRGSELHRHGRRRARPAARDLAGSQAPATTATADPTPAAWAPTRPRRWSPPRMHARIMREVIEPTIRGLAADGMPYTGFLYAGHHDRRRRHAQRARIQLPLRRSGDPAGADAPATRT